MLGVILDDPLEERYLDSSRYIRELGEAEEKHQLDHDGVLDELHKAIEACDQKIEFHGVEQAEHGGRKTGFMLARAAYFAEAHRRTALKPGQVGGGFSAWCDEKKLGRHYARKLARIGKSANPEAALSARRTRAAERSKQWRHKAGARPRDPLGAIKHKWYELSPVQRAAFVSWVMQQISFDKQAAD